MTVVVVVPSEYEKSQGPVLDKATLKLADPPTHMAVVPDMVATGKSFKVSGEVALTCAQPFAAAMVLVTVYTPAVLVLKLMVPRAVFVKFKPTVELNTPAVPVTVAEGFATFLQ